LLLTSAAELPFRIPPPDGLVASSPISATPLTRIGIPPTVRVATMKPANGGTSNGDFSS
jgi:hypothetical protein